MSKRAGKVSVVALVAAWVFAAGSVQAQQAPLHEQAYQQLLRRYEYLQGLANPYINRKADFFGGIDAAHATTFAWLGMSYAPIGALADDGWRIRFMGGAGLYSYRTSIAPGGINDANVFSAELLGGYRKTFDILFGHRLYAGAFAGLHHEDQILAYPDPSNPARGSETGIKGSLELYSRMWERYIASAFGSLSSVHKKYYAKASLLYELNETWAMGGEIAAMGDARYDEQRVGLAGSLTWRKKVLTLSAGALENSGRGSGAYLTLSVYSPF